MAVDVALTRLLEALGPWEADRPFDAATRHRVRKARWT